MAQASRSTVSLARARTGQDHKPKFSSPVPTVLFVAAQSCMTICDPMDCSPPGSSVHGTLQARILEWGAMPSSRGSSQARDWTQVSNITGRFFYQLSHRGSSRTLEWVDYPFSRGSFQPRNQTGVSCIAGDSLPAELPGKPHISTGSTQILFWKLPLKFNQWIAKLR